MTKKQPALLKSITLFAISLFILAVALIRVTSHKSVLAENISYDYDLKADKYITAAVKSVDSPHDYTNPVVVGVSHWIADDVSYNGTDHYTETWTMDVSKSSAYPEGIPGVNAPASQGGACYPRFQTNVSTTAFPALIDKRTKVSPSGVNGIACWPDNEDSIDGGTMGFYHLFPLGWTMTGQLNP